MNTLNVARVLMPFVIVFVLFVLVSLAATVYLSERPLMPYDDQLTDEPITQDEAENV